MSDLTVAVENLRKVFNKYAGKEGDKTTLTKAELTELLREELFVGGAPDKAVVEKFFTDLDQDKDGVVNFIEYATFVLTLSAVMQKM